MKLLTLGMAAFLTMGANSFAQKNPKEKTAKPTKTTSQVQEPTCPQGDIKCEAEKEQNREDEPKDQATDKSTKKKAK